MASITVKLPASKLGCVFVGKDDACLQRITPGGAMDGTAVKPGYIVESFVHANGEQVPSPSKKELIRLLKSTEQDPGRKMKFKVAFKKELEVELPASEDLGFQIVSKKAESPPIVTKIQASCPLKSSLTRGMVVDNITTDDVSMTGYTAADLNALLGSTSSQSGRKMTLKAPTEDLSSKVIDYEQKVVNAPSGDLGITWGGDIATIVSVEDSSPLYGEVFSGMKVGAIRIPDGRQIEYPSGNTLFSLLEETTNDEGRMLLFPSTSTVSDQEPLLKYYISAIGVCGDEVGIKLTEEGGDLLLAEPIGNCVPEGLKLISFSSVSSSGQESVMTPSSEEELDDMLLESSGLQRFFTFAGLDKAYMPSDCTADIPAGKLGATLKGDPAMIARIKPDSPLQQTAASTGMVVASFSVDGATILTNPSTSELIAALKEHSDSEGRSLKLINPTKY